MNLEKNIFDWMASGVSWQSWDGFQLFEFNEGSPDRSTCVCFVNSKEMQEYSLVNFLEPEVQILSRSFDWTEAKEDINKLHSYLMTPGALAEIPAVAPSHEISNIICTQGVSTWEMDDNTRRYFSAMYKIMVRRI